MGPDEEVVAGRRPVEEAFVARREAHRLLVVPQRREALEALVLHATALRIPVVEVEGGTLTSLAGFDGHQGVALVVEPRRWASLDDVVSLALRRHEAPLVLVLDSLEDPQNVGTLLRSAEACGVHGVIFPTRNAAPITPAAVKASAGATEHLLLVPVDDLPGTLVDLRARGLHLVGTDAEAPLGYRDADLRGPLALVVGSEGHGLGGTVRRRLELVVRIPMRGRVGSLNAAVAGSVLLFEAASQRPAATLTSEAAPAAAALPAAGSAAVEVARDASPGDTGTVEHGASGEPGTTARGPAASGAPPAAEDVTLAAPPHRRTARSKADTESTTPGAPTRRKRAVRAEAMPAAEAIPEASPLPADAAPPRRRRAAMAAKPGVKPPDTDAGTTVPSDAEPGVAPAAEDDLLPR